MRFGEVRGALVARLQLAELSRNDRRYRLKA